MAVHAGSSECPFYGPAQLVEANAQRLRRYASLARPLSYGHGFTFMGQAAVVALVSALLKACSPTAIPRLVVAVVIDAIKGVIWRRTRPHALGKYLGVMPLRANQYSPPSVVLEGVVLRIVAPLHHQVPNIENVGAGKAMGPPVGIPAAPTRPNFNNMALDERFLDPAVAQALPNHGAVFPLWCWTDDDELATPQAREVFGCGHGKILQEGANQWRTQ